MKSGSLSLLELLGPVEALYRDCFTLPYEMNTNTLSIELVQLHIFSRNTPKLTTTDNFTLLAVPRNFEKNP
jgi:hypothetical protein